MTPQSFVSQLKQVQLNGVFNPYNERCEIHDLADAAKIRRGNLRSYLKSINDLGADTVWMGRDLGYRGGRRTGLALTDEANIQSVVTTYPGATIQRATRGSIVAERTAAEIWGMLPRLQLPPLLWNVFPFHPHELMDPLTNRRFTSRELAVVDEINRELFAWLRIRRIICIGQDATQYAESFGVSVECVRHPSYGGVREFRAGMNRIYDGQLTCTEDDLQTVLF